MSEEFKRAFNRDVGREELKRLVALAEKEAAESLGGPVTRKHRFLKGDEKGANDVEFIWRLTP